MPAPLRRRGIATALMKETIKAIGKENILLGINAYGDMSYDKLKEFHTRFGFKDMGDGIMLREGVSHFDVPNSIR